jgi:hypothetical protein
MGLANTHITDNIVKNFRLRLVLDKYSHALVAHDLVAFYHASAAKADCLQNELVVFSMVLLRGINFVAREAAKGDQ